MEKSTVLAALTFLTLVSGLAVAAYQLWVTEDAKKKGLGGPLLNRPSGTTAGKDAPPSPSAAGMSPTRPAAGPTDTSEGHPT